MPERLPRHFKSSAEFRGWLDRHGRKATALLVAFHKIGSAKKGMTYKQALDEALCQGWIDGVRRSIDQHSYSVRFSPRKRGSIWSLINTKRAEQLKKLGLMQPQGLRTFAARTAAKTGIYSFENAPRDLAPSYKARFRADRAGWSFFESRPPWYQRTASFWVMSAKREETRLRRLQTLIEDSARGQSIRLLNRAKRSQDSPDAPSK